MNNKKRIALLLAVLMLCSLLAGCGGSSSAETSTSGDAQASSADNNAPRVVTLNMDTDFNSLDPLVGGSEAFYVAENGFYETLMIQKDDELQGLLAESWGWDDSNFVIKLKEGIKFHNGNDFTADDVLFTMSRWLDHMMYKGRFACVDLESSYAEDDYTVVLVCDAYNAALESQFALSCMGIIDKEWYEENDGAIDQLENGTGPYRVEAWNMGTNIVLSKVDDYWDIENTDAYFDTVDIRFFNDGTTCFLDFTSGGADGAIVINKDDCQDLLDGVYDDRYYCVQTVGNTINVIAMSTMIDDTFEDVRVREAICKAIDVETMNDSIVGCMGLTITSFMTIQNPTYIDLGFMYDPDTARALVEEYESETGKQIELELCVTEQYYNVALATAIQQYLAEVGIDCQVTSGDATTIVGRMMSNEVTFTINTTGAGTDPSGLFQGCRRGSNNGVAEFTDEELLDMIDYADTISDWDERVEVYHEIQRMIADNYYALPLFTMVSYYAYDLDLQGTEGGIGGALMPAWLYFDN